MDTTSEVIKCNRTISMKEIISDFILIGCGIAFTYIFLSIQITGGYRAVEPNSWIRYAEIGLSFIILAVGLERLFDDFKKRNGK